MKIFIDISSDKIGIYGTWDPFFLERNDVDKQLWKILVEKDKEYWIDECLVLNWPWGFTNLRVWTLALNLLKTLKNETITFFTISKPELYSIFYKKWWIPRYWILYIGQKTNVWLRDLIESKLIKMIKKTDIAEEEKIYWELFLDQVYDNKYFENNNALSFNYKNWNILFDQDENKTINRKELIFNKVDKLEANYMIEPNVS